MTLIALASIPSLIGLSYDQAALAGGTPAGSSGHAGARGAVSHLFTLGGIQAGIPGALAGQALAAILAYPMLVRIARKHGAWDGLHDLTFGAVGLILAAVLLV